MIKLFFILENEIFEDNSFRSKTKSSEPTTRPNHRVLTYPNFNLEKPVLNKLADGSTETELQMFTANEAILEDIQANMKKTYNHNYDNDDNSVRV